MSKLLATAIALSLVALGGCAQFDSSDAMSAKNAYDALGAKQRRTIVLRNWGLYLFKTIPIACGDPFHPGEIVWFEDVATLDNSSKAMEKFADLQKGEVIADFNSDIDFNGSSTACLIWIKDVVTSGTVYHLEAE